MYFQQITGAKLKSYLYICVFSVCPNKQKDNDKGAFFECRISEEWD